MLPTQQQHQQHASYHGLNGLSAAVNDVTDKSRAFSLSDEIISTFRQPMEPGETRQNIAFDTVVEEDEPNC